jgi:hypothetical protein
MTYPPSPYAHVADPLRDMGYNVIPIRPGSKVPGSFSSGEWGNLSSWQKWCDERPPAFLSDTWETWPNAGVGVAHGHVVGLDVDTDRPDVRAAIKATVDQSPCCRRGSKGWIGYYLPMLNAHTLGARLRWHDADGKIVVELLMHGTQSVLPPTIHPDTKMPYVWEAGSEALEDVALADLPRLPDGIEGEIDVALRALGITRGKMRAVSMADFGLGGGSGMSDLEKPAARSLNDRALEPAAINQWWPALGLPKTKQRGNGAWSGVAAWRPSGSGRSPSERNPNLAVTPTGIRDFGTNVSYTAIDVVMAACSLDFKGAVDWLTPFCRPEDGPTINAIPSDPTPEPVAPAGGSIAPIQEPVLPPEPVAPLDVTVGVTFNVADGTSTPMAAAPPPPEPEVADLSDWNTSPSFDLSRAAQVLTAVRIPTKAQFQALIMNPVGPFPIQNPERDCPGLLGEVAVYLDACSTVATEAGGLAVAIPVLGAMMGRSYETTTKLRTNVYTVGLGGSGQGKTSLMNAAKNLMIEVNAAGFIGNDRIKSGSGLLAMLAARPQRVCLLDEFGNMLQLMTAVGSGGHVKEILTEFTALYSAAATRYTGAAYATRPSEEIQSPHLCLFGAATPEQFWRAFGSSALEDGSVARFMIMPLDVVGMKDATGEITAELQADLTAIADAITRQNSGSIEGTVCMQVPITPDAEAARLALVTTMAGCADYAEMHGVKGASPILRRVAENAAKIALISAVGRSPLQPHMTCEDFSIGHAIARWSARKMIQNVALYVADNETERNANEVEKFIINEGSSGRKYSVIQRKFRKIRRRDMQDILDSLVEDGSIKVEKSDHQGAGRPGYSYFSISAQ